MSNQEPTRPYVYQPFGVVLKNPHIQHRRRLAAQRLWAVAGVGTPDEDDLVVIKGLTKMEAEAVKAALSSEPNRAVMLLHKCYQSGHREGWEDGQSSAEVMDEVNDFMCNNFGNDWKRAFQNTRQ